MMQVTGNNISNIKSVSIQSSLNGFSFCDTSQNEIATNITDSEQIAAFIKKLRKLTNKIVVDITTPNYIAIPAVLYEPAAQEHYFKVKSIVYDTERYNYTVYSLLNDTIVIIVPFERFIFDLLASTFSEVIYDHPMLNLLNITDLEVNGEANISIFSSPDHFAMSLTNNGKLIFCDYIAYTSNSDILYYIKVLINEKGFTPSYILCSGYMAESLVETLSSYHPNVQEVVLQ